MGDVISFFPVSLLLAPFSYLSSVHQSFVVGFTEINVKKFRLLQ
jgi:hypothetical protein